MVFKKQNEAKQIGDLKSFVMLFVQVQYAFGKYEG